MSKSRQKPPFWNREPRHPQYDIAQHRSAKLPKGERFETLADAHAESERSQLVLASVKRKSDLAKILQECRDGDYECNRPSCPICARRFRRWFVGELLRITEGQAPVTICTILLEAAARGSIGDLNPKTWGHMLRKRLERAGLGEAPAIGGVEVMYRAAEKTWILHMNLVVIGGDEEALKELAKTFDSSDLDRPFLKAPLKDRAEQLSYVLKFTTYHRPFTQRGANKSPAKPLNASEHRELMHWMAKYEFKDFLFLFNARRYGSKIALSK